MSVSFVPRYYEIEQDLRALIDAGKPDDPLPSDAEICERFSVSRMTARAAMQALLNEGLVYRLRGKGTFIATPPLDRQLVHLSSFSQDARSRGMAPSSKLIFVGLRDATDAEIHDFHQTSKSQVVCVDRIRLANDVPMAVDRSVLSERCSAVLDADLESGSMYKALIAQGIVPSVGTSVVYARIADAEDAQQLQVVEGAPLLVERRMIKDAGGVPVEATESRYAPDRFVLRLQFDVVHAE